MTEQTPTTPAEQTPTAPAATEATPTVPTGTPAPADGSTPPAETVIPDWAKDPATAYARAQELQREAAAARVASRDAAKAEARTQLLKELGLVNDDEPADPAKLATDLEATRNAAAEAQRELAIYRHAPAGTDVQALLDSRTFLKAVSEVDPTDTAALVAAITTAATSNPRFQAAPAAAPSSGGDLTPGNQAQRVYTRAQIADSAFYKANRDDILLAQREGRIK